MFIDSYKFSSFDVDAVAYMAAFSTPPNGAHAIIIDTFFKALKVDTTYSAFDELYLLGNQDSQASLLNCINPSQTLTAINSPTFTANSGWTGDASTSYLVNSTTFNAQSKFQQDSAHMGVWSLTNTANANYYDAGTDALVNLVRLNCRDATSPIGNINSTGAMFVSSSDSLGHNVINRSGASATQLYKSGSSIATDTDASTTVTSGNFTLLKHRASYSGRKLMAGHIGRSLTGGEVTTLYNALSAYKTAIGA